MPENMKKRELFSTYQIVAIGFAGLILLGTLLLMLPVASAKGESLSLVDAFFTATSAVCVTGLVVVDTGTYFSLFGQLVIIFLIQCGGVGLMTLAALMAIVLGRKINLHDRMVMRDAFNQSGISGVARLTLAVVKITLLIEFIGGSILAIRFFADYGWRGLYLGYWHAVSAFCNAGFDVLGNYQSVTGYVNDWTVNMVITSLIIMGGLGFTVMADIWQYRRLGRLSLHSKIVLVTTCLLIIMGTLGVYAFEANNPATLGSMDLSDKLLASYFHSVTTRTAGFNSLDMASLTDETLFLTVILMFIGASPTSTGGGIKTTTFAVAVLATWSIIRGKAETAVFGRQVGEKIYIKALAIIVISVGLVIFGLLALTVVEKQPFLPLLVEVVSAFGTVGLSYGITGHLTDPGKVILTAIMFAGRVGPLTLALALALKETSGGQVRYPEENINIG